MINFFKKLFLYISSLILWLIWWTIAIVIITLVVIVSVFLPKKSYNILAKILCQIFTYCVFIFPKHKGIKPKELQYPVIYVANHVSFFDLFISNSVLSGNPRGLELKEHFSKPVYGWFITRFGQIPIDIGNRSSIRESFTDAANILKDKVRNIFIMPEGSRTKNGKIGVFKSGAFYLSRKSGVPIVPVVYKGLYNINNRNSIIITPGTFDVIIMNPVYPDKFSTDDEMGKYVRDLMSKKLEETIAVR